MWCSLYPVRCGKVPSYGRAPADQAPPPLPPLCDVSQARRVIRPFGGVRGEERGASLKKICAAGSHFRGWGFTIEKLTMRHFFA